MLQQRVELAEKNRSAQRIHTWGRVILLAGIQHRSDHFRQLCLRLRDTRALLVAARVSAQARETAQTRAHDQTLRELEECRSELSAALNLKQAREEQLRRARAELGAKEDTVRTQRAASFQRLEDELGAVLPGVM